MSGTSHYEREIREYLTGRVGKSQVTGEIGDRYETPLHAAPVASWWIFEGKRYRGLPDSLASCWADVIRQADGLRGTLNPRRRALQTPEGEVDWLATALTSVTASKLEFVCRTSQIGLDQEERRALLGWCAWIARLWRDYVACVGQPQGCTVEPEWAPAESEPELRQLKRWAHVTRRSRWPLLRCVVAESLRPLFEPQDVDRLPLPSDPAVLFELLCLVRVLRSLAPRPKEIRWLLPGTQGGQNAISIGSVECRLQSGLGKMQVLNSGEFAGPLRDAMLRHGVRVPQIVDLLFTFERPVGGFGGILLEAKSGSQVYWDAVPQLKAYRAALRARFPGSLLVWGVTEQRPESDDPSALSRLAERKANGEDVWLFSSADEIGAALRFLGLEASDQGAGSGSTLERAS